MALDNNTLISGELWNPPYPVLIQAFGWLVSSILSLETILGNAMVLLAYHLERPISKQLNNRFIVSLAVSDLIIGIEGIPFFTVYAINGDRWPLGAIACETWLFLDYTLCLVSILTVLLITADRYLSVCHTAQYLKWQTPMKVQILIFASWILPALIFGLMIYGWPWIGEREEQIEATSNGECYAPFLANPFVNMSMYLAYYWTTLVAMLILYKGIHKAAKKLEKRSRAREHRHIALLLTQRLGTQVGVGLMLHARKYHEEVMKTKQPSTDVKDSGYTTNNTLSTNESTERRRSSFAILVKAVQSTQKLAQFRGRGTTFAFRTDSNEGNETPRRTRQLGIQMQPAKLERLSEQNSGGQIVETQCESKEQVNVNEKEENIEQCKLNAVQSEEYFKEIDADEEIDDDDDFDFPTKTMHYRFDSGAIASLTTEAFHEESLSSLLRFNPSALTSPVLDPAYSDSSSEIAMSSNNKKANGFKINQKFVKRHCFSLTSREQRNWGFIHDHITTGSLKERNIRTPNFSTIGISMPEKRPFIMNKESSKLMAKPENVCKDEKSPIEIESTPKKELIPMPMPLNICQSQQSLSIPISTEEPGASQRRISNSSSHHSHRSGDRRLSSRKTSKMECERHRKTHSSVASTAPGIIGQLVRRLSSWIQIGLGLNSTESSTNLGVDKDPLGVLPGFLRNSRSFSSMSSISSSTQPGMFSKRTSVLLSHATHQHQIQIPTLTITRDSLPQGAHHPATEIEEKNAQLQNLQKGEDNSRRSSGFLQALFAPISTFQRRRKKTKAERRAHKAFRTITFIVGLFAILWSPYYVVATVYGFCRGDCIPSILYNVSYYMCYLNSSLNPFAYALANRQFRAAFARILRGNFRQSN